LSSPLEQISSHLLTEFEAGRLIVPSLPEVISRISDAINDKRKGTQQVAKIIQLDPGLTARLIQIANSPAYRSYFPIDSCQMAVTRMGLRTTRSIITALVLHNIFKIKSQLLRNRMNRLWQHSCNIAAICYVLAQLHKGKLEPEKALLAGLVHDIGELPVLHYISDYPDLIGSENNLDEIVSSLKGSLGRKILQKWQFSTDLIEVPELADEWSREAPGPVDYVDLVIVAQVHGLFGTNHSQQIPPLVELPAFNKMSLSKLGPDASVELLHGAQEEVRKMLNILVN